MPALLFYSYSHKDENLRKQLEVHLSALKREGLISGWHDREITAGAKWKGEIDDHLKDASIILLLVSAHFLASEYSYDIELKSAMERHQKGEARVIPVILRPCDWKTTIFAHLQVLPTDGKPVINWKTRDDAFLDVVAGIRKALGDLNPGRSSAVVSKPLAATVATIPVPALNALHQLPAPPADFTGRADELKELLEAVKTGGVTISGLQGLGGVGKTALALKLAEQLKPDYPDAQFYVDLKGASPQPLTPRDAMAYVVRAWHPTAQLPEQEAELVALYRSVLDGKSALLLMDNARDAQQVAPLIPPVGCVLLVTSRKHFTLPGLVEKNLDKLPSKDARDLLLRIAPRLQKEKTDQVDELASLCGYLPLALRAVGSALQEKKNISPADYANRLQEAGKHLVLKEIDQSLQKSVGSALQSSYELLTDDLRQKFRFLSVFPDSFDLAAAAAVWDVPRESAQDPLGELLAYSLVEFDEVSKRYSLHDLVRLFADQRLNTEERLAAQKLHAGHYLKVLAAADELYRKGGESVTSGLALLDAEWTNIQKGQTWVAQHHQDDKTIAEWCALYPLSGANCLFLRQHPRERISWLEPALAAARRQKQRVQEGMLLGNLGIAHDILGDHRLAIEYHQQCSDIERACGNRRGEAGTLTHLGLAYDQLGEHRRAIEYSERSSQMAREIGDRVIENRALGNLGLGYARLGEHRRAIEYFEQSLQIARKIGDRLGEGQALGNLGNAYNALGDHCRAIKHYEQQLEIAREIGDHQGEANALFNSAQALDQLGDRAAALVRAEAAVKIYEAIKAPHVSKVREQLAKWREEDKAPGQGSAE